MAGGLTSATDGLFSPVTMSSLVFKCLNERRFFHTATLVPSTADVIICGGVDSNQQILASCERYSHETDLLKFHMFFYLLIMQTRIKMIAICYTK